MSDRGFRFHPPTPMRLLALTVGGFMLVYLVAIIAGVASLT